MPDEATPAKWIMGIIASLVVVGLSSFAGVLHSRIATLEDRQTATAQLVAEHTQQHQHATNVIRRLYEQREALLADVALLKERLGKLEVRVSEAGFITPTAPPQR